LAGLFLVSDDEEKAAELPTGNYDIPLVIQDRAFGNRNQLIFLSGNHMEQMTGFLGDWIMVNGQPDFRMQEVANDEKVRLNTLEVWEFINEGGGMGMMRNYLIESPAASV